MTARGLGLVYGGGRVGLMGVIADAVLASNGEVFGVIPQALATKELAHTGATQLIVTTGMHARKAKMAELAGAFVAMPGGFGTLDELFEALTWAQLGFHKKPIGLLNVEGYFDGLALFADHMVSQGFLTREHRAMMIVEHESTALLDRLLEYQGAPAPKWPGLGET
jgi:uncharacterized protein (TIGR00730 family)